MSKQKIEHLYKVITKDMSEAEITFFNQVAANLLKEKSGASELKLSNLVAVVDRTPIITDHLRAAMEQTDFARLYGFSAVLDLFRNKMQAHITQAMDAGIASFKIPVMLTSISSVSIMPTAPLSNIPGSGYHRDGGGKPLTTKITQTQSRNWQGGELHLMPYQNNSSLVGTDIKRNPSDKQVNLGAGQSILFHNQKILHAVNPQLESKTITRRTIYQERMNELQNLDTNILLEFGSVPAPLPSTSMLTTYLHSLLHPVILPKRDREEKEMNAEEVAFMKENETPDLKVRQALQEKHGKDFHQLGEKLTKEGVLILPAFLNKKILNSLQSSFEKEVSKKKSHPFLKQTSFNACVDGVDESSIQAVLEASLDPALQALIQYHLGQEQVAFASWRGYRQEPRESIRYRAWDWHNDQKALGPHGELKIMILLTDLRRDGQAMRVIKGSHLRHWNMPSQKFTTFNLDEALSFSENESMALCYGDAGTIIIFDTNCSHSGLRNLSERRDVITINFVPYKQNSPIMLSGPIVKIDSREHPPLPQEFWQQVADSEKSINHDTSPAETKRIRQQYYLTPKFEQTKVRFEATSMHTFFDGLPNSVSTDLQSDLDLPLRLGKHDVQRDIQFVAFRDASFQHPQYERLKLRLDPKKMVLGYTVDIEKTKEIINATLTHPVFKSTTDAQIASCMILLKDFDISIGKSDSPQRLRSNLIYIYFSLECIYQKISDNQQLIKLAKNLDRCINEVLSMYVSLVYLDDLNESHHEKFSELASLGDLSISSHKKEGKHNQKILSDFFRTLTPATTAAPKSTATKQQDKSHPIILKL